MPLHCHRIRDDSCDAANVRRRVETSATRGTTMTERPTYLPMLEAIANAERQGHEYYQAWYDHATDPDLKETMRIVATRELEHSLAFTKRIDELGFECQPAEILDFAKQIEIVTSDCSDYEKLQALELTDLADKILDPKTTRSVVCSTTSPSTCRPVHSSGATSQRNATPPACSPCARPRWWRSTARPTTARTSPSTGSPCSRRSSTRCARPSSNCRRPSRRSPPATARARRRRQHRLTTRGTRYGRSTS